MRTLLIVLMAATQLGCPRKDRQFGEECSVSCGSLLAFMAGHCVDNCVEPLACARQACSSGSCPGECRQKCTSNDDCPADCTCETAAGSFGDSFEPPMFCWGGLECGGPEFCGIGAQDCRQDAGPQTCYRVGGAFAPGGVCLAPGTRAEGEPCTGDRDCGMHLVCARDVCSPTCTSARPCDGGAVCLTAVCFPECRLWADDCTPTPAGTPTHCTPLEGGGAACLGREAVCPPGEVWLGGYGCAPYCDATHPVCGDGGVCQEGGQETLDVGFCASVVGGPCLDTVRCAHRTTCLDRVCRAPCDGGRDCAIGEACVQGGCLETCDVWSACNDTAAGVSTTCRPFEDGGVCVVGKALDTCASVLSCGAMQVCEDALCLFFCDGAHPCRTGSCNAADGGIGVCSRR